MKTHKILCTIGPSSLNPEAIRNFESNNVELLRINLSHTATEQIEPTIQKLMSLSKISICLDTEGAQIRTPMLQGGSHTYKDGDLIELYKELTICPLGQLSFTPVECYDQLEPGDLISIDFNSAMAQVSQILENKIILKVVHGGKIGSNKAVTVQRDITLSPFSQKDLEAFKLALKYKIKNIAFSFVHSAEDVKKLRNILGNDVSIISKIECTSAVNNLIQICQESDAILIDRGDLSRQVPIEKIPLIQKYIINTAKIVNRPAYVATNLLESMITQEQPTRAEVNDIYNTLADGADGLVLAAETAIGQYPAKCVHMVRKVIQVYEENRSQRHPLQYISESTMHNLPQPHGGHLNSSIAQINPSDIQKLPSIVATDRQLLDCEQIALGTFSPLNGPMNKEDLLSTLERYKLTNDVVWTMPLIIQVPAHFAGKLHLGDDVLLTSQDGKPHSILKVSSTYRIDLDTVARKWFGTDSTLHPGVKNLYSLGDFCVAGSVKLIKRLEGFNRSNELAPKESRLLFQHKGWSKVVGFHTRNIPHRAHHWAQMKALSDAQADGLYITPLVGPKKPGDFLDVPIIESYRKLIHANCYPESKILLGQFSTYPRYAGPREAIFTAICRKNMGCSHFIIGRDHSGVQGFYKDLSLEKFSEEVGDIGINLLFYPEFAYSQDENTYSSFSLDKKMLRLSGSEIRDRLQRQEELPDWMIHPEVANYLQHLPINELFY